MALESTNLFIVQKTDTLTHHKVTLDDLQSYIEATPSVTFKGKVNLTAAPAGDALTPNNGDMYVNDTDGLSNAGWTGINAATPVSVGDRVLWDSDPGDWILIADAGDVGGQVNSIVGQTPIIVDDNLVGNPTAPVISILDSTDSQKGAVRLATDAEATAGTLTSVAVTPAQLAANVSDISNEVGLAEGGSGIITGALVVDDSDISAMTVGVAEETFAPYDFSSLPDA